jgi:hypothetical protein
MVRSQVAAVRTHTITRLDVKQEVSGILGQQEVANRSKVTLMIIFKAPKCLTTRPIITSVDSDECWRWC